MHPLLRRLGLSAVVAALLLTFVSLPAPRAHAAETLLSQGRPVAASSTEEPFSAQGAVDGNPSTRWSSAFSDPQWIRVDLGAPAQIAPVNLQWEAAYGKAFRIEVSNDAEVWSTVHETAQGTGGTQHDHPHYMILNLAVGGDWPGPTDASTPFPSRLLVDYVRVYQ
ncbi:galactose-binding domain-containing protein [Streptomyces griseosporeus]|uniref:galactose-binding domain-containing protein n=1 Tax=Streptomyces griseosporeus TaxID=1910 RepID=UPI0019C53B1B|nr:discoidin domain-containing protein [Streptomyces griseosporeus]GHF51036.1 hypothetical protein GCM10018783_19540 [Streptomyces griseosporeus]